MSCRLKTTYYMLGLSGPALPAAPPPPLQLELQPDMDYSSDDALDPWFAVWHEVCVVDAEAEAAEEVAE
jgi:hypothetical protein